MLAVLALSGLNAAQAREVTVGVYANPPKLMLGKDGRPEGIFGELLEEIARREGWALRAVPCEWAGCLKDLSAGRLDLLPDVARTPERERQFAFHSEPALHSWSSLFVPRSKEVHSLLDLKDQRIAVLAGSVQETRLRELSAGFGISVTLLPVTSFEEGFASVADGRADAAAANHLYGEISAARHGLRSSSVVFQPSGLFFAVQRGANADLLVAIDRHLLAWKAREGSPYFRVMARWMAQPPTTVWPAWWGWAVAAALSIVLAVLLINSLLRRQVRVQTARLEEDLERLRQADEALRESEEHLKEAQALARLGNWSLDLVTGKAVWSDQEYHLLGYAPGTVEPNSDLFMQAVHPEDRPAVMAEMQRAMEPGQNRPYQIVHRVIGPAGERIVEELGKVIFAADGQPIRMFGTTADITDRKRIEAQIEHLAYHDPLTELPNRILFLDRLRQTLAVNLRIQRHGAVMFVDLDQFKKINDVHGHSVGDGVLREVARRLRNLLRKEDTVARFGGDEFVILLAELSSETEVAGTLALAVAEKVRAALEQPVHVDGQAYLTTASIGISLFPKQEQDIEDLIREADIAMYRAKDSGRNALMFFEQAMHAQISERYTLECDLREALKRGEFLLYLQSQVETSGMVTGAEVLLRWRHPTRGLLAPDLFIPLAEETRQIVDIGAWVLRESCVLLARLQAAGHTLRLAVNVSPRQFHQIDFVNQVREILGASGADPRELTLEITENLLVDRTEDVVGRMRALAELGVRFAIDDFGTGYSSLAYLKRLPLNELKIDKGFIRDVPEDANDVALVETILSMARHLNYEVVAEGVETGEQRDFLEARGCLKYQGYFFHRPQPVEDWLALLGTAPRP